MDWHTVRDRVVPYLVRVETPEGTGTGFLFGYNGDKSLCAIATAAHVVSRALRWRQPISLIHEQSSEELFLGHDDRFIDIDLEHDAAAIVTRSGKLPFPAETLPLVAADKYIRVGVELAWMGYPGIVYPKLCFFRGAISAFLSEGEDCYLIDGVAINGVSGGPVFRPMILEMADGQVANVVPELVGLVSAYVSNIVGTKSLPGLVRAQDVSPFYETLQRFKSLDEAKQHEASQPPLPPQQATEPPSNVVPPSTSMPEK